MSWYQSNLTPGGGKVGHIIGKWLNLHNVIKLITWENFKSRERKKLSNFFIVHIKHVNVGLKLNSYYCLKFFLQIDYDMLC